MAIVYSAGSRLWHFAAINLFRASHQFLTTFPIDYLCLGIKKGQGGVYKQRWQSFAHYWPRWHLWQNFFAVMCMGKSAYCTVDISSTTYPSEPFFSTLQNMGVRYLQGVENFQQGEVLFVQAAHKFLHAAKMHFMQL